MKTLKTISPFTLPLALAGALAVGSFTAHAGVTAGDVLGTTEEEVRAALESQGAKVEEIETEDGVIEVEIAMDGATHELEIDPATGKITKIELDDDEDDDDQDD
ncbi:MAG: PepSY domain-containing protein [Pseudomonadota bacterium]